MTGRKRTRALFGIMTVAFMMAAGCATVPKTAPAPKEAGPAIIPAPIRSEARPGSFVLGPSAEIIFPEGQSGAADTASYLRDMLRPTGYDIAVAASPGAAGAGSVPPGSIVLRLEDLGGRLGDEGYLLDVAPGAVVIKAATAAGLFYGIQSLRQLLPPSIEQSASDQPARSWTVPCVSIEDRPRFAWRGALLDCSRHFFPKEFVKRWIDILAMHKLNTFHWHLTDDQGWRIEIKRYPRLTEVGAWRVDREDKPWNAREPQKPGETATYGGFYSQDDIREIVAYAAARHVTIVPEIEMPGHAMAALASYPEFSCTGGPFTVKPGGYWPITDVFCPGSDGTFEFLANVLAEVVELFPAPFIHVGGDEVDKTEWKRCPKCQARMKAEGLRDENELQSYFIRRVEKILNGMGRRLVGWDEILEGGLAPQATVMSWRGTEGGIAAAKSGHDVVMTPTSHCYIDYYQGNPATEPPGIGGYLPLSKVYAFEPVPDVLTEAEANHVLGGQVNLWSEFVPNGRHAEYMALPRVAALAEAVWSPKARRDWADFASRVGRLLSRYEKAGMNFSRSAYLVSVNTASDQGGRRAAVTLTTEIPGLTIRYATVPSFTGDTSERDVDTTDPGPSSKRYTKPVIMKKTAELRAAAFEGEKRLSPAVVSEKFTAHAALGRRPVLAFAFSPKHPGGGDMTLTDGLMGTADAGGSRWQGFEGEDLDAVIDLGAAKPVRRIAVRCLQDINSWIFMPASVEFAVSPDGKTYDVVGQVPNDVSPRLGEAVIKEFSAAFGARRARFVRVRAKSIGAVPDWHSGAGGKAWLFADEIVVE